ncbi:MAG: DUF2461 domain-containing protein [Tannerellaceae bacterium]|nr:DUF2461 domain-containing protein [Tannerellaceae bacterium]
MKEKRTTGGEAAALLRFLEELREHNDREWFQSNRWRYEPLRDWFIGTVEDMIARLSAVDERLAGLSAKNCLYRINRDLRFSADKTLYKTHFGAYMAQGGKCSPYAGYYLHIEPGSCILAGGVWQPEPKLLKALRKDLSEWGEEFAAIVEEPTFKRYFPAIDGDRLKCAPAGYHKDHPNIHYLCYKSFCVTHSLPDAFFLKADWVDEAVKIFSKLLPFNTFLNATVDDFFSVE